MQKCRYKGCKNVYPNFSISFFKMPQFTNSQRVLWIKHIGNIKLIDNFSSVELICERHFYQQDLIAHPHNENKKCLKTCAVPKPYKKICNCTTNNIDEECKLLFFRLRTLQHHYDIIINQQTDIFRHVKETIQRKKKFLNRTLVKRKEPTNLRSLILNNKQKNISTDIIQMRNTIKQKLNATKKYENIESIKPQTCNSNNKTTIYNVTSLNTDNVIANIDVNVKYNPSINEKLNIHDENANDILQNELRTENDENSNLNFSWDDVFLFTPSEDNLCVQNEIQPIKLIAASTSSNNEIKLQSNNINCTTSDENLIFYNYKDLERNIKTEIEDDENDLNKFSVDPLRTENDDTFYKYIIPKTEPDL